LDLNEARVDGAGMEWHQMDLMQIMFTSLQTEQHASTSSLYFLQAGCSSWHPTVSKHWRQSTRNQQWQ